MTPNHQNADDAILGARKRMVSDQIRARGVSDPRVLAAMLEIPRERFLPDAERESAHEDRALPLDFGQTVSQPFMVAYMTELLRVTAESKVLEIGTGSGYQTAVLARLADHVYSVERLAVLKDRAAKTLSDLGIVNVSLHEGDGTLGLSSLAPYDRIIVTAGAPRLPAALVDQLADHGRLVVPVGGPSEQTVVLVVREGGKIVETPMLGCRFVKLVGEQGWDSA